MSGLNNKGNCTDLRSVYHLMGMQKGKQVIRTELQALNSLLEGLGDSFERAVETLKSYKGKIIVTGVGKYNIIGQKIAISLEGRQKH